MLGFALRSARTRRFLALIAALLSAFFGMVGPSGNPSPPTATAFGQAIRPVPASLPTPSRPEITPIDQEPAGPGPGTPVRVRKRAASPTSQTPTGTGGAPVATQPDPTRLTPGTTTPETIPAESIPTVPSTPAPSIPTSAGTPWVDPGTIPVDPTAVPPATPTRLPSTLPTTDVAVPEPSTDVPSGTGDGTSAAERFGWGTPNRVDEFTTGLGPDWSVYDGPGHVGNGRRSPDAVDVSGGVLTITGSPSGTTAGMAWNPGQKYGRWEGRVRAPASDPSYNALLLLWPDAEDWPVGGEVDFMEMMDETRQRTNLFLHYGRNNSQIGAEVRVDGTQWHNWAVEWTPTHIAAFVDGQEWFRTTDTSTLPPGPMHLCIQLDWFPTGQGVRESEMSVDWVKQYAL